MTPSPVAARSLLVSTRWSGHRLYYVRILARRSIELGRPVTVLLPLSAQGSREFEVHLSREASIEYRWLSTEDERRAVQEVVGFATDSDTTIFPDGDRILPVLAARRLTGRLRGQVVVLLMRTPAAGVRLRARSLLIATAKAASARALRGKGAAVVQLSDSLGFTKPHLLFRSVPQVRDPAPAMRLPPREAARADLRIPPGAYVVLSIGAQDRRKNPDKIVDAWKASPIHDRFGVLPLLVIAGAQSDDVRNDIASRVKGDESIVMHDRYMSDDEFAAFVAASDGVVLAYDNEGPSGLLAVAVHAQRPVLVAGSTWLRDIVRHYGIGVECALDPEALARGFDDLNCLGPVARWPEVASEESFANALLQTGSR